MIFPEMVDQLMESQKLLQALWDLRRSLKELLEGKEELELTTIMDRLNTFRLSSLRFLMYRDWGAFEEFSDAMVAAGNPIELRTRVRKFVSFLEMLTQEVSKRSVLRDSLSDMDAAGKLQ
jgi:hypothetical protein